MASANRTISGIIEKTNRPDISSCIEAAVEVADCRYELGTGWGDEVGLVYGAASEDILTGIKIHSMGWRTVVLQPNPTAFLCCAPTSFATFMLQQKRWATGFLETFFHKHSPILGTLTKKLKVRQCMAYLVILLWAARSVPELCYSLLSAYCLLCGTSFLPKITEPAVIIPITLFLLYQIYTLVEFIASGQSVRAWWNNERMRRITSATSWLYGLLSVLLKLVGLSETLFELTRKEKNDSDDDSNGNAVQWTFDSSPLFVSGTALVLVHIGALLVAMSRVMVGEDVLGTQPGELFCSVWVVVSFLPFVKGFFRGGNYGIPWSVLFKAAALALLFFNFSRGLKL